MSLMKRRETEMQEEETDGLILKDALSISAGQIIRSGESEPASGWHCAVLAVMTRHLAMADYLLKP
jgi:hypothetical protein